jgi:hypothetical protein
MAHVVKGIPDRVSVDGVRQALRLNQEEIGTGCIFVCMRNEMIQMVHRLLQM